MILRAKHEVKILDLVSVSKALLQSLPRIKVPEAENHICMTPENGVRRGQVLGDMINKKTVVKFLETSMLAERPMQERIQAWLVHIPWCNLGICAPPLCCSHVPART